MFRGNIVAAATQNPAATAAAFARGWFRTGDFGGARPNRS
jgi:long-subunit acyl-CoA synthetase (AMP-forming)